MGRKNAKQISETSGRIKCTALQKSKTSAMRLELERSRRERQGIAEVSDSDIPLAGMFLRSDSDVPLAELPCSGRNPGPSNERNVIYDGTNVESVGDGNLGDLDVGMSCDGDDNGGVYTVSQWPHTNVRQNMRDEVDGSESSSASELDVGIRDWELQPGLSRGFPHRVSPNVG